MVAEWLEWRKGAEVRNGWKEPSADATSLRLIRVGFTVRGRGMLGEIPTSLRLKVSA